MESGASHTLNNFDQALRDVRHNVFRMASIAEQNLEHAFRGLLTRNIELCNEAIADEEEVNSLEREVDADSVEILLRYNPVASDLREVISGMKVSNNLERVSDEANNIARRARKILKRSEVNETLLLEPLFEMALALLRDAIKAFAEGDTALGLSLYERDRVLDKAENQTIKEITRRINDGAGDVKTFLHLIFVVRSLERVGDHALNIAEDAIFLESAEDIRHLGDDERAALEIDS